MGKNVLRLLLVLCLIAGTLATGGVALATARTAAWVVSVTYQNVGAADATVNVDFYPEGNGTPITFSPLGTNKLAKGAGASFFIGSVNFGSTSFSRGSAVMSADQPLVATVVQFSQQSGVQTRMLSNGFRTEDAASQYMVATTLFNRFNRTTVFSVQNAAADPVTATINFYDADAGGALAATKAYSIPVGSSKYIDMDQSTVTGLTGRTTFNGSAIISGTIQGTATPANIVAAASELATNNNVAANFEGVPLSRASNTAYMATALCRAFGLDTAYAVQNASLTSSASVTVQYYDTAGTPKTSDGPYSVGPGGKKSIQTCIPSSGAAMGGFTGSATITSVGAPIVAIGKAAGSSTGAPASTANVFTAFMGEPAGASKLALPYVRWSNDANFNSTSNVGGKQRANIAIQNLESSTAKVNVKYFDKAGNLVGTHPLTIPAFSKGNSNAQQAGALGKNGMIAGEFGYYTDGSFGGAVVIEADPSTPTAKFIGIARLGHPGYAEDYNAVAIP